MRQRIALGAVMFCLSLAVFSGAAKADSLDGITFTLQQANLTGSAGGTLTWTYDVVNNSGYQILGLDVNAPVLFTGGTGNSGVFDDFADTGGVINSGSSAQGVLFSFFSDPGVLNSTNSGYFDLTILVLDPNLDVLDLTANYTATITTTPEPGVLSLIAVGLICLAFARKLR
jgi:hypothetical protein